MARTPISKRDRFEVFKRDGFKCVYCGAHPPEVTLEVDHIIAVSSGGLNDQDNLCTACLNCNRGKSDRNLSAAPVSLNGKTALIQEREEQLRGYYEVVEAKRQRLDDEVWQIVHTFDEKAERYDRGRLQSIKSFIERLGFHEVLEAAEIAMAARIYSDTRMFKYFCGVCWNKVRRAEERSQ